MVISKEEGKDNYRVYLPQRLMKRDELIQLVSILNYFIKTDNPVMSDWKERLEKTYALADADQNG